MKRNLLILHFIASLVLVGCLPMDQGYSITVRNNSAQTICVYGGYILPDTSLSKNKPFFLTINQYKTGYLIGDAVGDWNFSRLSTERLTIFFLSKDTLDKYNWSIVRDDYKILERREILEKDLENGVLIRYP